jgi:hypothetical protein
LNLSINSCKLELFCFFSEEEEEACAESFFGLKLFEEGLKVVVGDADLDGAIFSTTDVVVSSQALLESEMRFLSLSKPMTFTLTQSPTPIVCDTSLIN